MKLCRTVISTLACSITSYRGFYKTRVMALSAKSIKRWSSKPSRAHPRNYCLRPLRGPARPSSSSVMAAAATPQQMLETWLSMDTDPASRESMEQLAHDQNWNELEDLLCKRLEFGTAGLRGKMGPGFSRMNAITVQQTTQGLVRYLEAQNKQQLQDHGVAIGYDGRHHSQEFAHIAAGVVMKAGYRAQLFKGMVPTPYVAAAVNYLHCAAGIMVTASHNTKEYNGYKVYWGNGCQIIPPHDAGIAAAIDANLDLWQLPADIASSPLLHDPYQQVLTSYAASQQQLCFRREHNHSAPPLVYTPLHGVGLPALVATFARFGLPTPHVVQQQAHPDPEFPTVDFPNPEEGRGTWAMAFSTADQLGARLVLANDPDADRLAAAEKQPGSGQWQSFSGNEIGILLADWLWTNFKNAHPEVAPASVAMLASTVSSKMLGAMAAQEGFIFRETLTGFKWLANISQQLAGQGMTPLFAFEEAIGYMFYGVVKDKDGVTAAAVFAEMAAALAAQGTTVAQHLQALYQRYGHFVYRSGYFIADKPQYAQAVFDRLRHAGQYPTSVGGLKAVAVRDLGTGLDTSQPGGKALLPWTPGDMMITLYLEGGAVITVRASATEPKLKYYLEVVGSEAEAAAAVADMCQAAVRQELVRPEEHGLRVPARS